jgi:hypothetical protein
MARIDEGICERLINAATSHCSTAVTSPAPPQIITQHEPNWEAVTTGLTDLSTAISYSMFVLAIIGLLGLIGWVIFVRRWAKEEARKAAQEWFDNEAPAILRALSQGDDTLSPSAQSNADDIADASG